MRVCVRCRSGTATHKINHFLLLLSIGSGAPRDLNVFHQPKDTSGWRILTDQFNLGGFLIQSWVLAARKVPSSKGSYLCFCHSTLSLLQTTIIILCTIAGVSYHLSNPSNPPSTLLPEQSS